jgi:amino acid transporter
LHLSVALAASAIDSYSLLAERHEKADLMANYAVAQDSQLKRGIGPIGAISTNLLNMVGVGPFLTIPLALLAMGGPQAMVGWVLGAALCLCDGLVWAELGSAMPNSGGSYHYLLQIFGPRGLGRPMSFLLLWQSLLSGPLTIASGAVGFSEYAAFLSPSITHRQQVLMAMAICCLCTLLLYRNVRSIGTITVLMTTVVVGTCCWIVASGTFNFHASMAFSFPPGAFHLSRSFWGGLGAATLIAVYDYGGYNNVCFVGGEVLEPRKNIPRAVILSICIVAVLYLLMNISILGALDWHAAEHSHAVVADYMQVVYGHWAGVLVSVLILIVSFGSVFANLLGYSRIPYAASAEGNFFSVFARLHPAGGFPTVSLVFVGALATIACLFSLGELINVLIVVQAIFQFAAQCIAVMLLRRQQPDATDRYRMPFYPLPAIIALLGWIYIVATSGLWNIAIGLGTALIGLAAYLVKAKHGQEWPFETA